jgi:hypothetical protein
MPKRGFPRGTKIRPRDARGWRIPQLHTVARRVYDMMIEGKSYREIAAAIDRDPDQYVCRVMLRIRQPDYDNGYRYKPSAWYKEAANHMRIKNAPMQDRGR